MPKRMMVIALAMFFFFACVCSSSQASHRALWIWDMSSKIIVDDRERMSLFSFISAPHGNPKAAIDVLMMEIDTTLMRDHPDKVREFLADAHSRGLRVDYLTGHPQWCLSQINPETKQPYAQPARDLLNVILSFNQGGASYERFDGFQQDTEPYLLSPARGDPYDWMDVTARQTIIWPQYLENLRLWRDMIITHNQETADDLVFGVAIPFWWDPLDDETRVVNHEEVQAIVDYIAIMDYDTRRPIELVQSEFRYARQKNLTQSIFVGFETLEVFWKESVEGFFRTLYVPSTSYFYKGNRVMEEWVEKIHEVYGDEPAFAGMAFHYYENTANGQTAYRALDLNLTPSNHAPACRLLSPGVKQRVYGIHPIRYHAVDEDGDTLLIRLFVRPESAVVWTLLPSVDIMGDPMHDNDGVYFWDPKDMTDLEYRVKVEAADVRMDSLIGWDISDRPYSWSAHGSDTTTPSALKARLSVHTEHPTPNHPMLFSWEGFQDDRGIYAYYCHGPQSMSLEQALFTHATMATIRPQQQGPMPLTIMAMDYNGNLSHPLTVSVEVYADQDGDGIYDDGDADIDGDGIANEDEVASSSDPRDPRSIPPSVMIGRWDFDQDSLANSIAGKPALEKKQGAIAYQPAPFFGKTNKALCLVNNPAQPTYLQIQGGKDITPGAIRALTVAMWIKPEGQDFITYIPLVFDGDIDQGLSLILKNDGDYLALRSYYVRGGERGGFLGLNAQNDLLFDGGWHHVAFTYNGYDRAIKLYVDGLIVCQNVGGAPDRLEHPKALRFFDARSDFDLDNGPPDTSILRDNSAQFENNFHTDIANTRYVGAVDGIEVFLAAVPPDPHTMNVLRQTSQKNFSKKLKNKD